MPANTFSAIAPCHCGAGVRWTPLRSRSTDRAGRRDRRKVRGNPLLTPVSLRGALAPRQSVSLSRELRILSCYALRMTHNLVIANTYGARLYFRLPVIAIDFAAFDPRGNPFLPLLVIASAVRCVAIRPPLRDYGFFHASRSE